MVATTVTVALSLAAPALASGGDDESPASSVLAAVDSATETVAPSTDTTDAILSTGSEAAGVLAETTGIDAGDEITTTVTADSGNVDVSVRVLSPGVDEPVHQDPATPVISPDAKSDIAAVPATDAEGATSDGEPVSEPASVNTNVAIRILSPGSNGEVTQVHEGSEIAPTDAPAQQPASDPSTTEQDGPSVGSDPTTADATTSESQLDSILSENNSGGYQVEDSQYQSDSQSSATPWYWSWWFGIDCDGNATTSSTETGSPASLDWTWEWVWEWSCTEEGAPPPGTTTGRPVSPASGPSGSSESSMVTTSTPSSATGNTNLSVRVLSPGDNGTVHQTTSSTPAGSVSGPAATTPAGEPWDWSWTFTFCDATTTLANQGASGTPLRWAWEWTWNWSCDSALGPPPDLSDAAQPDAVVGLPVAGTDVISAPVSTETLSEPSSPEPSRASAELQLPGLAGALRTLITLAGLAGLEWPRVDVATAVTSAIAAAPHLPGPLGAELSLPLPSQPAVDVSVVVVTEIPSTTLPGTTSPRQVPSEHISRGPLARVPAPAASTTTGSPIASGTTGTQTTWTSPAHGEIQAAAKPTATRPTVRPAPPDRPRSLFLPLGELGSSRGSGAGTSGGLVPSVPVVAVAALTGLFVLVAPGVGRRIRIARELSPRATYRSSIDHPG